MPRKAKDVREQQVYRLDDGAIVTIDYLAGKRPKFFQPADGVVIIGPHVCGAITYAPASAADPKEGPTLAEIHEFQRRREAQEPVRKRPFTSEDAALERGFNPQALSFETLSGIAAGMPPVVAEETVVE